MALTKTLPTQDAAGLSIVHERLLNSGRYVKDTNGLPRLGVLPVHYGAIVSGSAGMSYNVGPFNAIVSRTGLGVEEIANDATTAVSTTTAPASNSRIDVIYVRPQFVASSDAANQPLFGVAQGSPSGSPIKPTIPAGALELATAVITSTTTATSTATITQTYQMTSTAGGIVAIRNATERAAFAAARGQMIYRIDLDEVQIQEANGWVFVPGLLVPTAVTGGTFDPETGRINLSTAARQVSVDGIFTTRYTRYRVDYHYYTGDQNGNAMRFRSGGVDETAAAYTYALWGHLNGASQQLTQVNQTQFGLAVYSAVAHWGYFEVSNAMQTAGFAQKVIQGREGYAEQQSLYNGILNGKDAVPYDGFTFKTSSLLNFFGNGSWIKVTPIC